MDHHQASAFRLSPRPKAHRGVEHRADPSRSRRRVPSPGLPGCLAVAPPAVAEDRRPRRQRAAEGTGAARPATTHQELRHSWSRWSILSSSSSLDSRPTIQGAKDAAAPERTEWLLDSRCSSFSSLVAAPSQNHLDLHPQIPENPSVSVCDESTSARLCDDVRNLHSLRMNVMRRQARQMAAFECMHTSNMQLKQTVKQLMQYVHQTTGQHDEHPLRTQKNKNKVNPHSAVQDDFLEENVRRSDKTATLPSRTACCGAASFPPGATAAAESQPFCHRTAGCCSHYSHPGSGPHSGPNCSTALAAPLARSLPGHSASNPSFALQVDAFAVHAVEWKICGISEVLRAVSSGAPGAATMSSPRFCIPKTNIRDVVVDFHPFFDHKATNEQSHRCAIIIRY
eukprot:GHVT01045807.1.p1 GENE.GHVT01045807.1~~GHVT01045807.1.p1  ORF type:complete len:397 (+),score=60.23 GHVT01045807.1:1031-2221(+)